MAGCSGYKPATAAWCSLPLSYNLSPWGYRNHHFVEQQPNTVKWRYNQPLYKTVTPPCQSFLYKWLLFFPYTVSMVAQSFPYQWLLYPPRLHYHSCTCTCTCNCTNGCSILTVYHHLKVPACTNGCSIRSVPTVPLSFLTKWLFLSFLSFSTNSSSIFPLPMVVPFILYQWFFYPPCTNVCSIYSLPLVPVPVFVPFILYHWFLYQCLFH